MNTKSSPLRAPLSGASSAFKTSRAPLRRLAAGVRHVLPGFALPALLLLLWQTAAALHWMPSQTLPAPALVWDTLRDLAGDGELFDALLVSLRRLVEGLAIGSVAGVLLGAAMGASRRFDALVRPPFFAVLQIPTLAWIPLLMMCLGIGETLKLVVIAKAALAPVVVQTRRGVRDAPAALIEVARACGLTRAQRIRRLYLPAALPALLTGVQLALADGWLSLMVVEMLASSDGIGYLILNGRQLFQLDVVLVGVLAIGLTGRVMDVALAALRQRLLRWPAQALGAAHDAGIALTRGWQWSGLGVVLIALLGWQALTVTHASWLQMGATPARVAVRLVHSLVDPAFWMSMRASFARYVAGLAIGVVLGGSVGALVGLHPLSGRLINPTVQFLRHVAIFAWLPLITAWAGLGEASKVAFVALATLMPMLVCVAAATRQIPPGLHEVTRVLGLSRWRTLRVLIWPAAAPGCFAGLHLCLVHAWLATIGAEYFMASGAGIGSLMINAEQMFQMDVVIAAMIVIGLLGSALNGAGRRLEHWATTCVPTEKHNEQQAGDGAIRSIRGRR